MSLEKKYFETGSNPYYPNLGNTAKDFSFNETTNPQNGLLNSLTQNIIIEENIHIHTSWFAVCKHFNRQGLTNQ